MLHILILILLNIILLVIHIIYLFIVLYFIFTYLSNTRKTETYSMLHAILIYLQSNRFN